MESTNDISTNTKTKRKPRSATSPRSRETEMIQLAMDSVEERIRTGKASSAELVHFLKLGTEQAKLEKEKLESENLLLKAKTEQIQQQEEVKELFATAIRQMTIYQGRASDVGDDYDD